MNATHVANSFVMPLSLRVKSARPRGATNGHDHGEWYAALELVCSHPTLPYRWEQIKVALAKYLTRKETVKASRWLVAAKAKLMDADTRFSVNVRSALERRPKEWK